MGISKSTRRGVRGKRKGNDCSSAALLLAVLEIPVHIQSTEYPFHRIYLPISISIEFLHMVMHKLVSLRIAQAGSVAVESGIIALRVLQHTVECRIHCGLEYGLGLGLFGQFRMP